jgi:hypothetical protein
MTKAGGFAPQKARASRLESVSQVAREWEEMMSGIVIAPITIRHFTRFANVFHIYHDKMVFIHREIAKARALPLEPFLQRF